MRHALLTCALFIAMNLPLSAGAADMAVVDISDFSGGLNTRDGIGGVADNELTESFNCYLMARGIAKRSGFSEYNDSTRVDTAEDGMGVVYAPFTGNEQSVAVAGDVIAYKGADTWTDITGDVTITAGKQFVWCMVNNTLVGVNGTDAPIYWTGTGNADSLAGENIPTSPAVCAEYAGRLFLAQGNTLYWSNYLGDWQVFHPDDYQPFNDDITGLRVYGQMDDERLIVFTRSGIHACVFDPAIGASIGGRGVFRFSTISTRHGCVSPYSVQECLTADGQLALIWADIDGLKAMFGSQVMKLTDKIQPTWDDLSDSDLNESIGVNYQARPWYLLVCRTDGASANNRVIVYDLRHWCVAGVFDWAVSTLGTVRESGVEKLVGCDYNGYWHYYDSGTDDGGTAINAYFRTKSYDGNDPLFDKGFTSVVVEQKFLGRYDLDFTVYADFLEAVATSDYSAFTYGAILGEWVLGVDVLRSAEAVFLNGTRTHARGRNVMVRVTDDELTDRFEIYRILIPYERGRMVLYR